MSYSRANAHGMKPETRMAASVLDEVISVSSLQLQMRQHGKLMMSALSADIPPIM